MFDLLKEIEMAHEKFFKNVHSIKEGEKIRNLFLFYFFIYIHDLIDAYKKEFPLSKGFDE